MIQIAGPNGSGKTTFYREFLKPMCVVGDKEFRYINADAIELEMRGEEDVSPIGLDPELSNAARIEADRQRELLLTGGFEEPFIFETVFSDPDGRRIKFMQRAKDAGYFVVLIFIGVRDVALAAERVQQRVVKGEHDVPFETQELRFPRVLENGRMGLNVADLTLFMDNSSPQTGEDVAHQPVAVFLAGDLQEIAFNTPDWFDACWPHAPEDDGVGIK